jgi:hypothetical protein
MFNAFYMRHVAACAELVVAVTAHGALELPGTLSTAAVR